MHWCFRLMLEFFCLGISTDALVFLPEALTSSSNASLVFSIDALVF